MKAVTKISCDFLSPNQTLRVIDSWIIKDCVYNCKEFDNSLLMHVMQLQKMYVSFNWSCIFKYYINKRSIVCNVHLRLTSRIIGTKSEMRPHFSFTKRTVLSRDIKIPSIPTFIVCIGINLWTFMHYNIFPAL